MCWVDLTVTNDLESFVNGLLGKTAFGTVLQQAVSASGSCRHLIDRYIHDYTQMVYTPHSKLPDEELQVFWSSCQSNLLEYSFSAYCRSRSVIYGTKASQFLRKILLVCYCHKFFGYYSNMALNSNYRMNIDRMCCRL